MGAVLMFQRRHQGALYVQCSFSLLSPPDSLVLDLQDGGVVVQDGQDDFVHVLPEAVIYLLLLLQGVH